MSGHHAGGRRIGRRAFLIAAFSVGVTAAAGVALVRTLPPLPKRPEPDAAAARGWITYLGEGKYQLVLPRIEMGQNIATALKQIACDELGAGWDALSVEMQDTARIGRVRSTVGSESVMLFALPLARACAALRDAVAAGRETGAVEVDERPVTALRSLSGRGGQVGQSPVPVQAEHIVRGMPLYTADVRRPGMLFGRVLRAPCSPEIPSHPVTWDQSAAARERGFAGIVSDDSLTLGNSVGLGILATTPGALDRIAAALSVRWSTVDETFTDPAETLDIDQRTAAGDTGTVIADDGPESPARSADVDLRFDMATLAHGQIEPRTAVAEPDGEDGMTLWVGHQDAFLVRDTVADRLGLDADRVRVRTRRIGGAFGGKAVPMVEPEAAVLARHAGRPVKVQWTRIQEFRQAYHRPPSSHRIRAHLDAGRIAHWSHRFMSGHVIFTNAGIPAWMQAATDLVAGDPGVARGADIPYRVPGRHIAYGLHRLPVLTGPWRGLGAGPNMLAIEQAIDEAARMAGADPFAFRLAHLDHPRLQRTLTRLHDLAGGDPGKTAADETTGRRGRGIACGIYKGTSLAATQADVRVAADGAVQVIRLWTTHDCGRIINPDQVRAQCEGNLVWGIGMVLGGGLTLSAEGEIREESFAEAPIPRGSEVPEMIIDLIDSDDSPTGAGETVIVSAAAAIANAVRDATGIRPTAYPLRPGWLTRAAGTAGSA